MGVLRLNERGSFRGILLNLLVAVLIFAGGFFWAWHRFHGVSPVAPPTQLVPRNQAYFSGDPAQATDKLLQALNQKLSEMDLLKLLDKDVETFPVTVQGKVFSSYRECFRLPRRYNAGPLAETLGKTAQSLGARLISAPGTVYGNDRAVYYPCSFIYDTEWVPVAIQLERPGVPCLCLIIDDGGYQKGEALEHLYALKVPVTVAIIPDVEFSKSLAEEFPAHGVEVMCHMPMEGHEKGEVGSNYKELLKKGMTAGETEEALKTSLDDLPNVRGLNNHMGSVATEDPALMEEVCQVLKARGLFAIDSRTTAQSVVEGTARREGVPVAHRDVFLDNEETPEAIQKQLEKAVDYAREHGLAVAIGHFKEITLTTLQAAIPQLKADGIQFVYASEVVK